MRIDLTMTQKEATYQVILDIIKSSSCYNAFLITFDVPEIYMQQFWFTVKKIKKSSFYQFQLDDKKFEVDVELFYKILHICPRASDKEFIVPSSHDSLVTFLKELGYKGPLEMISDLYVDYMHQPWRTLATTANKCLSGKTSGRGKGIKGKRETITPTKKGSVSAKENILSDPNEATELANSMSKTEAEIADEEQRIHETHASIVIGREQASRVDKEAVERQKKKKMKGIATDEAAQELLNLKNEESGTKPKVPNEPKIKSKGSSEGAEEIILSIDDEETELEKETAKSEKADDKTADEEEGNSDDEVHTEEDEQTDDEAHDDEYVNNDVEKHDDVDEEMNNVENDDEVKEDQEMVDAKKVKSKKIEEEKVDKEQAGADQDTSRRSSIELLAFL
ncbi:hypothetical protein Tco_1054073 [Tanacetum coccineum]|uniref:Uncharacterized protein n=1 Tax=Tanacetum coccineum TaxID=301880 RepID=A0ABQ5GVQ0_9ASTR